METSKQHADKGGEECPKCGSDSLEYTDKTFDGGGFYQRVSCDGCPATWTDCYELTGYADFNDNKGD